MTADALGAAIAAEEHRQGRPYLADPEHCERCAEVDRAWAQAVGEVPSGHLIVNGEITESEVEMIRSMWDASSRTMILPQVTMLTTGGGGAGALRPPPVDTDWVELEQAFDVRRFGLWEWAWVAAVAIAIITAIVYTAGGQP